MSRLRAIFEETAGNEKEHGELFFKHLKGGMVEIKAAYPAGIISSTADNLKAAAAGEKLEWGTLYPSFGDVAEKEGFMMLPGHFGWLQELRFPMSAGTTNWLKICSWAKCSRRMRLLNGNAATAA